MRKFFSFLKVVVSGLSLVPMLCSGNSETAISGANHKAQLNTYVQNAKKLEEKNLNRFSMEVLYQYDKVFDSLFNEEKNDTLTQIASQFEMDTKSKRMLADSLDVQVKKLSEEKEVLRHKYFGLLRKAILALVIWLGIVAVILYLRTKAMKKNKLLQAGSEASLATYQTLYEKGDVLLKLSAKLVPAETELTASRQSLLAALEEMKQKIKAGELNAEQVREIQNKMNELLLLLEKQDSILHAAKAQREPENEVKTETDINSLCKYYLDLATCGFANEELPCKVTTDFEKRLPKIKVFPQAIGHLLNNLFANSFRSMQEKSKSGDKNYKPALTVSTRVLPRFIQIRIKDNGTGIKDDELQNVLDYFYSLHPPEEGAGLGLAEANRIMKEIHQGEISMESDVEKGTDVYLKFFTGNEKS